MRIILDIPDDDYSAVRCEALYYIGSDRLAQSVTTAFQNSVPYATKPKEHKPKEHWVFIQDSRGNHYGCPTCKHEADTNRFAYCPWCGSEMFTGDTDENSD